MKQLNSLINADAAILSVAQLIQPCKTDELAIEAKSMLRKAPLEKRQIKSRIKTLLKSGYLWARSDELILVTPKGFDVAQASLSPKDRDKFRLFLLNKQRYQ